MNKIAFVGRKKIGILLRSLGIDDFEAKDALALKERMRELLKENKYILILTEEVYVTTVKDLLSRKTGALPVVMMLPTLEVTGATLSMIGDVVGKAVGVNILSKKES